MTGFSLANPKLHGERDQARQTLERQPANRPAPGTAVVTDKGLSGQETEEFGADAGLGLADLGAEERLDHGQEVGRLLDHRPVAAPRQHVQP